MATALKVIATEFASTFEEFESQILSAEQFAVTGYDISFDKSSLLNLRLNHSLYLTLNGYTKSDHFLNICSDYGFEEIYEVIEAFRSLTRYFGVVDISKIDREIVLLLLFFSLSHCKDHNNDLRYYAFSTIINMLDGSTASVIIPQLLSAMDFETLNIKCLIIRNIEKVKQFDSVSAQGLCQKAISDTNFIVRRQFNMIYKDVQSQ